MVNNDSQPDKWQQYSFLITLLMLIPALVIIFIVVRAGFTADTGLLLAGLSVSLIYIPLYFIWKKYQLGLEKLAQLRSDSSLLLDSAHDMIIQHTLEGRITTTNKPVSKILGYSKKELQALNMNDLDQKKVFNFTGEAQQQLLANKAMEYETLFQTRNGDRVAVEVTTRMADKRDKTKLISIVRDISVWKETEQALEASRKALERARNRLETRVHQRARELKRQIDVRERAEKDVSKMREFLYSMFDSMPSIIIALDLQQRVTQWNRQAEKMTGILAQEALGQSLAVLMPEFQQQIEKYSNPDNMDLFPATERIEAQVGGENRLMDVMVYPLRSAGGAGIVIRVDDVTEKARIEDVLVQTEKMMSLGGLAAGMAHEINNPLGAMLQSSQNLRRRLGMELVRNQSLAETLGLNEEAYQAYLEKQSIQALLDTIDEGGKRAATIVEDMLSFARPGGQEEQAVDVVAVMNASIRLAQSDFSAKKQYDFRTIAIHREFIDPIPRVSGRKNRLQQVFLNLMTNAAQAVYQAQNIKPAITISISSQNQQVVIEVSDNGPGMPESVSRRIFEPFFSTKAEGSGTGLGLSVSYFIITDQMGGSMEVQSQPGQGSRFIIKLPFAGQNNPRQQQQSETEQQQFDLPLH